MFCYIPMTLLQETNIFQLINFSKKIDLKIENPEKLEFEKTDISVNEIINIKTIKFFSFSNIFQIWVEFF